MKRIWVQPGDKDRRVPDEQHPGTYFPQGVPQLVRLTQYIQNRLDQKDLVEVDDPGPADARAEEAPAAPAQVVADAKPIDTAATKAVPAAAEVAAVKSEGKS
jgi:hypothetical protein